MKAEVIIPSWNRVGDLRRALDSLRSQTAETRICVVDNGSTDGTAAMVASEYPEVRLLRLDRNAGFGRAINEAAATSQADVLVLMNNDAEAEPGFVAELLRAQGATGAAMVAGLMVSREGVIESAGVVADQSLIVYDHLFGQSADALGRSQPDPPLGPSGGAALYVRQVFVEAGMYDPEIFAYLEDLDLALRLRLRGASCALALNARVVHEHSATLGSGSSSKNRLLARNRRYLVWKYGAALAAGARARGVLIDFVVATGRMAIDRNAGGFAGWWDAAKRYPRRNRPTRVPGLDDLPLLRLSLADALGRRFARRR